jgi:hypothetical protein
MGVRSKIALSAVLFTLSASLSVEAQQQGPIQPAQLTGSWKNAAGNCTSATFKGTEAAKTVRGEEAITATVVDKGMTINGIVILRGAREGQMVNAMNDMAIFLVDILPDKKLSLIPIGAQVLSWPDQTLEPCQ